MSNSVDIYVGVYNWYEGNSFYLGFCTFDEALAEFELEEYLTCEGDTGNHAEGFVQKVSIPCHLKEPLLEIHHENVEMYLPFEVILKQSKISSAEDYEIQAIKGYLDSETTVKNCGVPLRNGEVTFPDTLFSAMLITESQYVE